MVEVPLPAVVEEEEELLELDETLLTPLAAVVEVSKEIVEDDGPSGAAALRRKHKPVEAEMDMTPMVDVTFLLLIFFMVTASFALQKSKQLPKPEPKEEGAQSRSFQELEDNPDYITVHIDGSGAYRVVTADWDRDAFSESEMLRNLREARQGVAGGKVPTRLMVRADGEVINDKVVAALDAASAVGMEDIQLLTVEEDSDE